MNLKNIRNFCIIAHIDHGKSTLADRLMELTGTVEKREMKSQLLDSMDLEREKGITIKLTPVSMNYNYQFSAGALPRLENLMLMNLIDTPGHVDFSYEVSRSLAAVEGALLVVDATQGIEAQTLANVYLALEADLQIIPIINKIDLPAANIPKVTAEIVNLLGCDPADILPISAKTGEGVPAVLEAIVEKIPAPTGDPAAPLRALIFDSYFDDYRGVVLYIRIVDGSLQRNDQIRMLAAKTTAIALEVGKLSPQMIATPTLTTGEIGYIVTNLKSTRDARVGDTVSLAKYFKEQK